MVDDIRPLRVPRRDYTGGIINARQKKQAAQVDNKYAPQQEDKVKDNHPAKIKKIKKNKRLLAECLVICAILVVAGIIYFKPTPSVTQLPASVANSLDYQVYYPTSVVNGYNYKAGSAKVQTGILFFTFANRSKRILFTEQNAPSGSINLSSLPKHTPHNVPIGQAVIGTSLGNPSIVIMTDSTLVQLTSSKGVSKTDIIAVAQKLSSQN